ncbi:hypothetical protein AXF42_Ash005948 [Apostasia shenzhenica]|uniref:Plant-specific TFIIB-related protein PTF2 n=1 Tax=Apostasia shenzhenica TaxID=1088818 RepID=A0A2I0AZS7_9ASPA|nr:hypothetical protein AXF42_Ash005948 [Apostasia shenzhenica]
MKLYKVQELKSLSPISLRSRPSTAAMAGCVCRSCGEGWVVSDPDTGFRVCGSCGCVHDSDVFENQSFASDGTPHGSLHFAGDFGYRERKLYHARKFISDLTSRLGLSAPRAADVARLASQATDGDLGSGDWFPVLVAACAVIVMRQHRSPLSLAEAAEAVSRHPHDLGRMVARVADQLGLGQLPEFNAVCLLEHTVRNFSPFSALEKDRFDEILGQSRFLLHCAIRWFLTTGRHPLPVVAAVLAFVAEVNGIGVGVEEIASEIRAGVPTSRRRLKELVDVLVRVSKVLLPWGEDITVKNIVHNAPVLIRFMELKSKSNKKSNDSRDDAGDLQDFGFNLDGILNAYSGSSDMVEEESRYFKLGEGDDGGLQLSMKELESLKLSAERIGLSDAYESVLCRLSDIRQSGEMGKGNRNKRRRAALEIEDWVESWHGRWESEKGLTPEEMLEQGVGYESLPPSFINGLDLRRRRRVKIDAAKKRILQTMKRAPVSLEEKPSTGDEDRHTESVSGRKRRRRKGLIDGIDWEDCIIELLLLHQVNEEEIEQGHYNRLLDLHVFSSTIVKPLRGMHNSKNHASEGCQSNLT